MSQGQLCNRRGFSGIWLWDRVSCAECLLEIKHPWKREEIGLGRKKSSYHVDRTASGSTPFPQPQGTPDDGLPPLFCTGPLCNQSLAVGLPGKVAFCSGGNPWRGMTMGLRTASTPSRWAAVPPWWGLHGRLRVHHTPVPPQLSRAWVDTATVWMMIHTVEFYAIVTKKDATEKCLT